MSENGSRPLVADMRLKGKCIFGLTRSPIAPGTVVSRIEDVPPSIDMVWDVRALLSSGSICVAACSGATAGLIGGGC